MCLDGLTGYDVPVYGSTNCLNPNDDNKFLKLFRLNKDDNGKYIFVWIDIFDLHSLYGNIFIFDFKYSNLVLSYSIAITFEKFCEKEYVEPPIQAVASVIRDFLDINCSISLVILSAVTWSVVLYIASSSSFNWFLISGCTYLNRKSFL